MTTWHAAVFRPAQAELAEGPAWDARTDTVVWVDILAGHVWRERPDGTSQRTELGVHVGAALPCADPDVLLVCLRDGFHLLDSTGGTRPLATPLADRVQLRFNDGKVDPRGRAYAGTMPYGDPLRGEGALFRLDPPERATVVVAELGLSNGLGWAPDQRTMYLVDSARQHVMAFDYDADSAHLGARTLFLEVPAALGMPDGLCVDDEGGVWVALWDGGAVHRYRPDGRLDRSVTLPASRPTSMCFRGSDLIVTSARYGLDPGQLSGQRHAGDLFAVPTTTTGAAATPWRPPQE